MSETFLEHFLPLVALQPDADRWTSSPATDIYNLKLYGEITFLVVEGAGGTGTTTLTIEECDDTTPTNSTAIAFDYRLNSASASDTWGALTAATSAGIKHAAGANKACAITIRASQLSDGYPCVRLQTTEDNSDPCDAVILAIAGKPRYAEDVMKTAIS